METTLGLILQLLILACQIGVCALSYLNMQRGPEPKGPQQGPDATESAISEEERRMQEQMQRMMDGMNNILGYDGKPQGDKR